MTKTEMAKQLAEKCGLANYKALECLSALFDADEGIVASELVGGHKVVLPGFGTFGTFKRRARNGRNPFDGSALAIPEKKAVRFKAGKTLRDRIEESTAP